MTDWSGDVGRYLHDQRSYATAYGWGSAMFAFGAVRTALLFRRGVPTSVTPALNATEAAENEPAIVH